MLSVETKAKLRSLLVAIAEGEISLEKQRIALGKLIKFEPYSAFQRIDRGRTGYVDSMAILEFLRNNGFTEETEADTYYLMKFFDVDDDEKLNYTEFLTMVLPWDNAKLRADVTQRPNYYVGLNDYLSKSIEYELCKLFVKEIAFHRRTEKLKQELSMTSDFDCKSGFKAIDDWNYNYIDFSNLKRFLKSQFYIPTNKDLTAIIRRLDLNADSRLSFDEFEEGIKPVEPHSRVVIKNKSKLKKVIKSLKSKSTQSKKLIKRPKTASRKSKKFVATAKAYGVNPNEYSFVRSSKVDQMNHSHDHIFEEEKISPYRSDYYDGDSVIFVKDPRKTAYESPYRASNKVSRSFVQPSNSPPRKSRIQIDDSSPRRPPPGYPANDHTLKHTEERELVTTLNDLLNMEYDLENLKINLSLKPDF